MREPILVDAERVREVLDVLTGWSGNAALLSLAERVSSAVTMLNELLEPEPQAYEHDTEGDG